MPAVRRPLAGCRRAGPDPTLTACTQYAWRAGPGSASAEITIRSRVSYADLDLTSATGALELENRIRATAESSCRKIDVEFPAEGSSEAACIKNAVDNAMQEARKVIDARRKTP